MYEWVRVRQRANPNDALEKWQFSASSAFLAVVIFGLSFVVSQLIWLTILSSRFVRIYSFSQSRVFDHATLFVVF
jgi:hypothetical protein